MGHLLLAATIAAGALAAQERGALLVATEASRDADFSKTVVLVIVHDSHEATGLVLNRPVKIPLAEVFPGVKTSQTAWAGGPVLLGVNALLLTKAAPGDASRILRDVYLITSRSRMRGLMDAGSSLRVYLGVCGWGRGQLENEIQRGLWLVKPGSADMVFDAAPVTLWKRLSRRTREPGESTGRSAALR